MAEKQLGSLYVRLVGTVDKFQKAMKDAEKSVNRLGRKFTSIGKDMSVGISAPLAAIAALAVSATGEMDDAFDSIRTATGKTGDELKNLQDSFEKVFKSVPVSAADAAKAIGELHARTGQTGEGLQALLTQVLNLSRLTKSDLSQTKLS